MREISFCEGEIYHVYNRGVEKRDIFLKPNDQLRFIRSINEFNDLEPIGSLFENSLLKNQARKPEIKKLVSIICYALNPNHFHFILRQNEDRGIEKFMHRLGTGYTNYFNVKNKHQGHLFQGTFKAIHVDSNEYLLHLSAYVNLNDKVHQLRSLASKLSITSWAQFLNERPDSQPIKIDNQIILEQFNNRQEYRDFALSSLVDILENKKEDKELSQLLLEDIN